MIAAYFRYLWRAGNLHGLHSPFVYALYRDIIRHRHPAPPGTSPIETLRQSLLRSKQSLTVTDLGAGSRRSTGNVRAVSTMARNAQKPARYAWLLHRLALHFNAGYVLELGTSLGLTTAYLANAAAQTSGQLYSFEGCPNTATLARSHLNQLGYSDVNIVVGNLDDTLAETVATLPRIDLVFFDANHRYEPTVQYFMTCLPFIHNDTLFIFDDIHWSAGMEQAWEAIKAHPAVQVTIDLFGVGLVFFRREQPKQHFVLRF
ncbi:O-methyltransferase [Fibrella forsythiae]|uniref:Class I SAM-dependent methyltransferase n=1 Tax=Fibrella forsythiae TaxID=2817061 RepID=A0ABS3JBT6_9BACT|nr:class I SAM-dependent methyltransferase [Fibrella forsythiae]MBO0947454.1 class I SAM-dependent methyltransferase [Fibrella forsythiae]